NLPTQGPGRWIAIVMAVSAFFAGLGYAVHGKRDELIETRRGLLARVLSSGGLSDTGITLTGVSRLRVLLVVLVLVGSVLALVVLTLCIGLASLLPKRDVGAMDPDTRDDLLEAREALLSEIVALERAHKTGDIGPKYYGRARAALLDALSRIVDMLDAGR